MGTNGNETAKKARRTVLIVEDDAFLRTMYGFLLEQDGFNVLSAPDGPSAVRLIEHHGPTIDLVVTDFTSPGRGGLEAWRHVRTAGAGSEPELLFLAGEPNKVKAALDAEGLDRPVLAKPFHPDAFLTVVRTLLSPRVIAQPG